MKLWIYQIKNKVNGKIYIGSTANIKRRWADHIYLLDRNIHHSLKLQRAWNKYGKDSFEFSILEEFESDNEGDKYVREQYYLDLYKSYNRDIGFNISKNALAPMDGRHHSEETKRKFSETRKGKNHPWYGKHHTEETRKKISESNKGIQAGEKNPFYGRHHSEETKNKISEANKGRHLTDEQKQHLSEVFSGSNNPFYGKKHSEEDLEKMSKNRKGKCCGKDNSNSREIVKLDDNFNCLEIYTTVTEAAKNNNVQRSHIALVCRGERKHTGGFKWMYKEDYENYIKNIKSA